MISAVLMGILLGSYIHNDYVKWGQRGREAFIAYQGTPMLHGSLAYLECRLHSAEEAGDHTIFIAEVEDVVVREGDPLLFFRGKYRNLGNQVS